eukprot:4232448-Pyramimonas_sp.AAC.1
MLETAGLFLPVVLHTLSGGPASGKQALLEPLVRVLPVVGRGPATAGGRCCHLSGDAPVRWPCILSLRCAKSE